MIRASLGKRSSDAQSANGSDGKSLWRTTRPANAARLRKDAIAFAAKAEKAFGKFDFVNAAFAAENSWRSAAAYRDLALGLAPGTSELQKGTQKAGAASCPSAHR